MCAHLCFCHSSFESGQGGTDYVVVSSLKWVTHSSSSTLFPPLQCPGSDFLVRRVPVSACEQLTMTAGQLMSSAEVLEWRVWFLCSFFSPSFLRVLFEGRLFRAGWQFASTFFSPILGLTWSSLGLMFLTGLPCPFVFLFCFRVEEVFHF